MFEQVAAIQNWYNSAAKKLPKEQLIAVVLRAAPKEYTSVLTTEQGTQGDKLELSHLHTVMNKKNSINDDVDDELALTGADNKSN